MLVAEITPPRSPAGGIAAGPLGRAVGGRREGFPAGRRARGTPSGLPSPFSKTSLPIGPSTSMPTPSALPPKSALCRWVSPLDWDWNGCELRESVKLTAEPATLRLLIAVAWTAVRPVVPTIGNSN